MNQREYAVTILEADGSTLAVSHWGQAEDALAHFSASLRLAGHPPHQVQFYVDTAAQQLQRGFAYVAMNPEFGTGAVEIMAAPSKGR